MTENSGKDPGSRDAARKDANSTTGNHSGTSDFGRPPVMRNGDYPPTPAGYQGYGPQQRSWGPPQPTPQWGSQSPAQGWNRPGPATPQDRYAPAVPGSPLWGRPDKQRRKSTNRTALVVLAACAAILLVAIVSLVAVGLRGGGAKAVMEACADKGKSSYSATLSDDEKSIVFDSGGKYQSLDTPMLDCLLSETEAPSAVRTRMEHTRALDGTQDAEWDGWEAFWTYHPDNGFAATFTKK